MDRTGSDYFGNVFFLSNSKIVRRRRANFRGWHPTVEVNGHLDRFVPKDCLKFIHIAPSLLLFLPSAVDLIDDISEGRDPGIDYFQVGIGFDENFDFTGINATAGSNGNVVGIHYDGNTLELVGGSGGVMFSIPAVSGPFGRGRAPEGYYLVNNLRGRGQTGDVIGQRMILNGIGFSADITPQFCTDRTLLRIHPDTGSDGTSGCIGLQGDYSQLRDSYFQLNNAILNGPVPLTINY